MTTTTRELMTERIRRHGQDLLKIFPNATERDPVKLCNRLRRLEAEGQALALRLCNGPEFEHADTADVTADRIIGKVNALLGNFDPMYADSAPQVPVFLNRDPRGYALKISDEWLSEQRGNPTTVHMASIHRDWGGYGIIAPDLSE